jgi:hypothetical protein
VRFQFDLWLRLNGCDDHSVDTDNNTYTRISPHNGATDSDSAIVRRLEAIEARNRKVGFDKAWERSATRRLTIAVATYLVVSAYGYATGSDQPYLDALVPVVGFLLSTLTVPLVKKTWVRRTETGRTETETGSTEAATSKVAAS